MRTDLVFTAEEVVTALMQYAERMGRLPNDAIGWHIRGAATVSEDIHSTITLHDVTFDLKTPEAQ